MLVWRGLLTLSGVAREWLAPRPFLPAVAAILLILPRPILSERCFAVAAVAAIRQQ
jgi:hypothetical protein